MTELDYEDFVDLRELIHQRGMILCEGDTHELKGRVIELVLKLTDIIEEKELAAKL